MSYQPNGDGYRNREGYWAGYPPSNPYHVQATPQPQNLALPDNAQRWNQNAQIQHPITPVYPNAQIYSQNFDNSVQYISPAQLMQQPPSRPRPRPTQQSQRGLQSTKMATPMLNHSSRMTTAPVDNTSDMPMLLVSLAEEYFAAARDLSSSVALSMTEAGVKAYTTLIATGLGCLDTALKRQRPPPRLEANIRLRFAGILFEETDNTELAEMCLSKGIGLCERNHYYDLKYAMQFLLAQIMAKKNRKVSMKALDGHVADAQVYQHYPWAYVFRFLRASYALESGSSSDSHAAIQNLQAIANLASHQGDYAIHLLASLMEAIAYMKTTGTDSLEHVQRAIAAARSHQMESTCRIPQLVGLTHILDLACAIKEGKSPEMLSKLKAMQNMMDDALKDSRWGVSDDVIEIPIGRSPKSSDLVSSDTRTILGIRDDGGDKLMVSFLSKKDAYSITYLLSGIVLLHKHDQKESKSYEDHKDDRQKGLKYLQAGLDSVEADMRASRRGLLSDLVAKRQWREQISCYFRLYIGFCWAGVSEWTKAKRCIDELETSMQNLDKSLASPFGCLFLFLKGVYYQGSGDLDTALRTFQDAKLHATQTKNSNLSSEEQVERDIGLLAALSAVWILQEPQRRNLTTNTLLIEELEPFCANHPNKDIRTAFNLTVASFETDPPAPLWKIKSYLRAALDGAQTTANTHFLCITLSLMFSRFFSGVVGEQAVKSARAAVVQADKTRNVLWLSVTNGLLGECYDVQGKREEAQDATDQAQTLAQKAIPYR